MKLFSGHFYGQSFIKTVRGPLIYVTHITPLKAVILFKMLLLCSLVIQLANYIRNLNN